MLRLAVLLSILTIGAADRIIAPFQYGWRFHFGDETPASRWPDGPGTCAFEEDLKGLQCTGMEGNPNRFSEKDCRTACCYDPDCLSWQQFGNKCSHGYKGMNVTCKAKSGDKIEGGRRTASPSPAFRTDYKFAVDASSTLDQDWPVVDAPHDFIAERANFTDNPEDFKHGFLERNVSWYRKHFKLTKDWQSGTTWIHFEGIFHHATIFLNGHYLQSHECGYTGFVVRLDNATGIRFGDEANVIAIRADATFGSGHWYEGGGIYRPVHLVHLDPLHFVLNGLFVPAETDGSTITATAEVEHNAPSNTPTSAIAAAVSFAVQFTLHDDAGTKVASIMSATTPVAAGTTIVSVNMSMATGAIKRWSVQSPTQYTMHAQLMQATTRDSVAVGDHASMVDSLTASIGFRTTKWDGQTGFALNEQPLKLRGFSHHNSIAGLGVAIPARVYLFRVQASRASGSNIWRMSHNPYADELYGLLDATGVMCWDENRDYGAKYMNGAYAVAMHDMVKTHRYVRV
jgi:beta-galactosidase/beta-glucuronidase